MCKTYVNNGQWNSLMVSLHDFFLHTSYKRQHFDSELQKCDRFSHVVGSFSLSLFVVKYIFSIHIISVHSRYDRIRLSFLQHFGSYHLFDDEYFSFRYHIYKILDILIFRCAILFWVSSGATFLERLGHTKYTHSPNNINEETSRSRHSCSHALSLLSLSSLSRSLYLFLSLSYTQKFL